MKKKRNLKCLKNKTTQDKKKKKKNQAVLSPEMNGFGETSKWLHAEQKGPL